MKTFQRVMVLGVAATLSLLPTSLRAADAEGIAVAIVYDTSGSMKESVRDQAGKLSPKYVIANRALLNIANRLQAFTTGTNGARTVKAGLFVFDGSGSKQAVKFGPFDVAAFQEWTKNFSHPTGGTPLGNALTDAANTVLHSGLTRKHVLLLTDGNNTIGPAPAEAMKPFKRQAESQGTAVSVHFVAFDVDAGLFSGVKKLGATVVGAANEPQLNSQLEFILEKKILLEEEEPSKK
jgi:hypothetical protein